MLIDLRVDQVLHIQTRDDAARWHDFVISAPPVDKSTYYEIPIVWQKGGQPLAQQRTLLSAPGIVTYAAGSAMTASTGTLTAKIQQQVYVSGIPLLAEAGAVATSGVTIHREYAYPFDNAAGVSTGMTLRQWYAGQALVGFIAAGRAANLIGRLPQFCFKLADSMIELEQAEMSGKVFSPVSSSPPPRGQQTPTPQSVAPGETQIAVLQKRSARG